MAVYRVGHKQKKNGGSKAKAQKKSAATPKSSQAETIETEITASTTTSVPHSVSDSEITPSALPKEEIVASAAVGECTPPEEGKETAAKDIGTMETALGSGGKEEKEVREDHNNTNNNNNNSANHNPLENDKKQVAADEAIPGIASSSSDAAAEPTEALPHSPTPSSPAANSPPSITATGGDATFYVSLLQWKRQFTAPFVFFDRNTKKIVPNPVYSRLCATELAIMQGKFFSHLVSVKPTSLLSTEKTAEWTSAMMPAAGVVSVSSRSAAAATLCQAFSAVIPMVHRQAASVLLSDGPSAGGADLSSMGKTVILTGHLLSDRSFKEFLSQIPPPGTTSAGTRTTSSSKQKHKQKKGKKSEGDEKGDGITELNGAGEVETWLSEVLRAVQSAQEAYTCIPSFQQQQQEQQQADGLPSSQTEEAKEPHVLDAVVQLYRAYAQIAGLLERSDAPRVVPPSSSAFSQNVVASSALTPPSTARTTTPTPTTSSASTAAAVASSPSSSSSEHFTGPREIFCETLEAEAEAVDGNPGGKPSTVVLILSRPSPLVPWGLQLSGNSQGDVWLTRTPSAALQLHSATAVRLFSSAPTATAAAAEMTTVRVRQMNYQAVSLPARFIADVQEKCRAAALRPKKATASAAAKKAALKDAKAKARETLKQAAQAALSAAKDRLLRSTTLALELEMMAKVADTEAEAESSEPSSSSSTSSSPREEIVTDATAEADLAADERVMAEVTAEKVELESRLRSPSHSVNGDHDAEHDSVAVADAADSLSSSMGLSRTSSSSPSAMMASAEENEDEHHLEREAAHVEEEMRLQAKEEEQRVAAEELRLSRLAHKDVDADAEMETAATEAKLAAQDTTTPRTLKEKQEQEMEVSIPTPTLSTIADGVFAAAVLGGNNNVQLPTMGDAAAAAVQERGKRGRKKKVDPVPASQETLKTTEKTEEQAAENVLEKAVAEAALEKAEEETAPLVFANDVRLKSFQHNVLEFDRPDVTKPWSIKIAFSGPEVHMTKLPPARSTREAMQHPAWSALQADAEGNLRWAVDAINGSTLVKIPKPMQLKALESIKKSTTLSFLLRALKK